MIIIDMYYKCTNKKQIKKNIQEIIRKYDVGLE